MAKEDEVPVTGPFLSLVKALHSARTLFIAESQMAEDLALAEKPDNWNSRCRELFFTTYREQVTAMGLRQNESIYEALMRLQVPEAAWNTEFSELPRCFMFDPWAGMGYGGIRVLGYEEDLSKCPQCGGETDNGIDGCIPPSACMCSKCCAQEAREKQGSAN